MTDSERKQKIIYEVDSAFRIYQEFKDCEWSSWHRVLQIIEGLRSEDQRLKDMSDKREYARLSQTQPY